MDMTTSVFIIHVISFGLSDILMNYIFPLNTSYWPSKTKKVALIRHLQSSYELVKIEQTLTILFSNFTEVNKYT